MTNLKDATWKMFKVGDVINIKSSNGIFHAVNVAIENERNKSNHPYVVRTSKNNGVRGYIVEDEDKLNPGNTISFAQDTAQMFYQAEPYFTGNKVKVLEIIGRPMTEEIALFLISVLKKGFSGFGWGSSFNTKKMYEVQFPLPVTATGSIDWDFMTDYIRELEQERIRELEQERIRELDAYLKAAGLDSYELNAEDKRVLALYREALEHKYEPEKCELQFGEFRLNELFDIETTWIYGKNKQYQTRYNQKESGSVAVVSGVTVNNGINYYTKDNLNSDEIFKDCLTISTRGEYSGTVFYHDEEFALANNILAMPMPGWSKEAKLYMMVVLKSLPFGGYNGYPTKDKLSESCIELPINDTGDINFDFMEKYIKAIEKVSIANVVKYKNKVIAATKQVVNGNSVSDAAAA